MAKTTWLYVLLLTLAASPTLAQSVQINEFLAANQAVNIESRFTSYVDWIELYNPGSSAVDLGGYTLTDDLSKPDRWRIPDGTLLQPRSFILFWADDKDTDHHTNFKLSKNGEQLGLFSPNGEPIDTLSFGPQYTDVSYGRSSSDPTTWGYMAFATPRRTNAVSHTSVAASPTFDLSSGFYNGTQSVELSTDLPNGAIHYTLDGSPPTLNSTRYTAPLQIDQTMVVRARVFADDHAPSEGTIQTFLIDEPKGLPVVSLITDPDNFFHDDIGIYVVGTNGSGGRCAGGPRNWNRDWERPVHVEFFETDGSPGFKLDAGVGIFGGCTRTFAQKSLEIVARDQYGPKRIEYPVFADRPVDAYKAFLLRNSGQDWKYTMFRDGLSQILARDGLDVDGQAFRSAIVFLNGAYWGIHNLREKLNAHYVENHFDIDSDDVELLNPEKSQPIRGLSPHYNDLVTYLENNDLTIPEHLEWVQNQLDVDAYIDYLILNLYVANVDWPGNNLKLWRPNTEDGRWRWMTFDLDRGFGGDGLAQPHTNALMRALAENGANWPNPPWSTFLFRKLLTSDAFKHNFIQRFALHLNTTFATDRILPVVDSLQALIAHEMPRHQSRWPETISLVENWAAGVEVLRTFARERPDHARNHIIDRFELSGMAEVTVETNDPSGGQIYINEVLLPDSMFTGEVFRDIPIQIEAVPADGFFFAQWEGSATDTASAITLLPEPGMQLRALFMPNEVLSDGIDVLPPQTNQLLPNYPNPFSHTTDIAFRLAQPGTVSLHIHDILGREVAALLNEETRAAGIHKLKWDAAHLPNGVYFYTLQTSGFRATRNMILLR